MFLMGPSDGETRDVRNHMAITQTDLSRIEPQHPEDMPATSFVSKSIAAPPSLTTMVQFIGRRGLVVWLGLIGAWMFIGVALGWDLPWNVTEIPYTPMSPVAEQYWRNLDVAQVQRDMAGWKREDLARLFVTVQAQAFDPETREHIAVLGKTLGLPGFAPSSSLWSSLLRQPGFLMGLGLAIGMWLAAAWIGLAPLLRRTTREKSLDEVLQNMPADQEIGSELLPAISLETPAPGIDEPTTDEKKEEQKETSAEPTEEDPSPGLGDLTSLFEEEDTSISALEAFCRNLAEIEIDNLMVKVQEVAHDLRNVVALTPREDRSGEAER